MEPVIREGTPVVGKKNGKLNAGDLVIIWVKPEFVAAGEHPALIKRLVMDVPHWVKFPYRDHPNSNVRAVIIVEQINPHRQFVIPCDRLLGIHKCLGPLPVDAVYNAKTKKFVVPSLMASPQRYAEAV